MVFLKIDYAQHWQTVQSGLAKHWKPATGMIGIAIIVGKVWGRTAVLGVALVYVSTFQALGPVCRVFNFIDLKSTAIPLALLVNLRFNIIPATWLNVYFLVNWAAVQINFWGIYSELSNQTDKLQGHNQRLEEEVGDLKDRLLTLMAQIEVLRLTATKAEGAQNSYQEKLQGVKQRISQQTDDFGGLVEEWSQMLRALSDQKTIQERMGFVDQLRQQVTQFNVEMTTLKKTKESLEQEAEGLKTVMENVMPQLEKKAKSSEALFEALKAEVAKLKDAVGRS